MGKQLSVKASGAKQKSSQSTGEPADSVGEIALKVLWVEGRSPTRLDMMSALRKRFPAATTQQLYPFSSHDLAGIQWNQFELVFISCPSCINEQLSWLRTVKQRGSNNQQPLVVVLTDTDQGGRDAVWEGADLYLQYDVSTVEFAAQLDTALEVDRLYRQYPLSLPEWHLSEVLHDSENAVIFLADNKQGEQAVIKRFKFDVAGLLPEVLQQFMADAAILMQQHEAGLVALLDAGMTEDALYLVMEYVGGVTLSYMLDEDEEITAAQRLDWFTQVVQALAAIHGSGLLHRDLKASNIMMREDGSLVLLDFGVESHLLLDSGFLWENEIYATPFYISPERIVGEPASEQSDLYALGILLYELLTGDKPFLGRNLGEVLQHHVFSTVPDLPATFSLYQPLLSALLAKSPEGRIKSAAEVLCWLDELANQHGEDFAA